MKNIWIIFCLLLVVACPGSKPKSFVNPESCSIADQNQAVYDNLKRFYLWYDQVDPGNLVNPRDTTLYPTVNDLLNALVINPPDRFSYVADQITNNQLFNEGEFLGVGLRLSFDVLDNLFVAFAFTGSPAYDAGIRRGDQILQINGYNATGLGGDDWNAAWGADIVGTEVILVIRHPDSSEETFTVQKAIVSIDSTQIDTVIQTGSAKIGYLHFTNFLNTPSINDLNESFTYFSSENISELVVDLRYNGGGAVRTANYLANHIAGYQAASNIFTRLIYNNNPDGYNGFVDTYTFSDEYNQPDYALNLNRVFIITSPATCSASEIVINAFAGINAVDVIVIGDTTCGKPIGFQGATFCDKVLFAANFETRNAQNIGEYFTGIDAAYTGLTDFCAASDDLGHLLGDAAEASLATAISYVENGRCPVTVTAATVEKQRLHNAPMRGLHLESNMY